MNDPGTAPQLILDGTPLTNTDVAELELARARHALGYLKRKLGNDRTIALLSDDTSEMRTQVQEWMSMSAGEWQSGTIELTVQGCTSAAFLQWYNSALEQDREDEFRAGHPEHFVSHPRPGGIDVIENIGETELPWALFYRSLPPDGPFPVNWDPRYPVRFGAEILDADGIRIGFSMRQARDTHNGMHLKVTSFLPKGAPATVMRHHRHHLAIEYRNWVEMATTSGRDGRTQQTT